MRHILCTFWHDDCGSGLLTGEWLFLFAILVVGVTGGLVGLQKAMSDQLDETAKAINTLNRNQNAAGQGNGAGKPASQSPGVRGSSGNTSAIPMN